jgi:hypothetical protein
MEIAYHCRNTPAMRPSEVSGSEIPLELDQLIVDCMAADPALRPANADAVIARLDAITFAEPWCHTAARNWWAGNLKRVGSAGHPVAVRARDAVGRIVEPLTEEVID